MANSLLSNRLQAVKIASHVSAFIPVANGVPQGSVLGPLLFLIFINDLVDLFGSNLCVKLFADDVKIYVSIGDVNNIDTLQTGLTALCAWASTWQLTISVGKCAVLHLGKNNSLHSYSINAVVLPSVTEIRDLGVMMDSKLSFSAHYSLIVCKAHQRACLILRCFKSRDPVILFRAFTVYVRPLLEYCSPVWSPGYKTDIFRIESVQKRFTKRLNGCQDLTYKARFALLKTETLELRRLKQDLLYMYKIIRGL